jgi:hypothetical protein
VLLAFNLPEANRQDLAGFAVQYATPDRQSDWLSTGLTFADPVTAATTPAQRQAIATSTEQAPVQTFHWVQPPPNVIAGRADWRGACLVGPHGSSPALRIRRVRRALRHGRPRRDATRRRSRPLAARFV